MNYLSLFSGLGGFEFGLHSVFKNIHCVGFSEIDKHAIKIYKQHFPQHLSLGDVTKIDFNSLGHVDLIVGGSPCQDLSGINPNRKSFDGKKSCLFFKFVEALEILKPKYFVLENVCSMNPIARNTITLDLKVEPIEINAACFGPQNRRRLIWANFPIDPKTDNFNNTNLIDILDEKPLVENLKISETALNYMNQKFGKRTRLECFGQLSSRKKSRTVVAHAGIPSHVLCDERFEPTLIRKFSVEEIEKLQGYDKWVTSVPNLTRTSQIRALGNSINCQVSIYIAQNLFNFIFLNKKTNEGSSMFNALGRIKSTMQSQCKKIFI
jgi:site-specific DNA-cytosine methylase